ncbi:hypothetical protein PM082_021679 [Marasmius tenuissimus]|nr:hypothetical protein PM082_021679 [Marasmius tenuissimus]
MLRKSQTSSSKNKSARRPPPGSECAVPSPREAPAVIAFPPSRSPSPAFSSTTEGAKQKPSQQGLRAPYVLISSAFHASINTDIPCYPLYMLDAVTLSPKKRPAAPVSDDDDSEDIDLDGLTLRSPLGSPHVRRSGRKHVPTERMKQAIRDSLLEMPSSGSRKSSALLDRLDHEQACSQFNDDACATEDGNNSSDWAPSTSRSRVSRGGSRPQAVPRSKWQTPPRPARKTKQSVASSDDEVTPRRAPSFPRSISPVESLPTTSDMIDAVHRAKRGLPVDSKYAKFINDAADPEGSNQSGVESDGGYASWNGIADSTAKDIDEYDLSDSFIDDGGVTDEESTPEIGVQPSSEVEAEYAVIDTFMDDLSMPFDVGPHDGLSTRNTRNGDTSETSNDADGQVFYEDYPPICPSSHRSSREGRRSKDANVHYGLTGQKSIAFASRNPPCQRDTPVPAPRAPPPVAGHSNTAHESHPSSSGSRVQRSPV